MRRKLSSFARWIEFLTGSWSARKPSARPRGRRLAMEPLGKRDLLAILPLDQVDLGAVRGKVFDDLDGNNIFNSATESGIANVDIALFNDLDGDGVLDGTDTQVGVTIQTNSTGDYQFLNLAAGKYLVRQTLPTNFQLVGAAANTNPRAFEIDTNEVDGRLIQEVDNFNTSQGGAAGETVADTAGANPNNSSFLGNATDILGSEREVEVEVTSTTGTATIGIDSGTPNVLDISFDAGTTAKASLLWDGSADSGASGNALGLGNLNLTALGATGFLIHKGADRAASLTIRVYSDASNVLSVDIPLSDSGGALETTGAVFVPFSDLTNFLGTAGTVTKVQAIELLVNESTALDGQVDFLSLWGPQFNDPDADFADQQQLKLGNFIFHDLNNNGVFDTGETKLQNVDVKLYRDNGTTPGSFDSGDTQVGATVQTDANGEYLFTGLAPDNYLVQIPQAEFDAGGTLFGFISSRPNNTDTAIDPDNNVNDDDNGVQVAGSGVVTQAITLSAGGEPTNDGDTDANTNLTLDLGVVRTFTLGNFVFNDVNNSSTFDSGDLKLPSVDVTLYRDNGATPGVIDATDTVIGTQPTDANGNYLFTGLLPGDYIAQIPQAEFTSGNLVGFQSSAGTTAAPDPDTADTDNDDNGAPGTATGIGSGVVSLPITLSGDESNSDGDNNPATNLTLDFGVTQIFSLGNQVWNDLNNNGVFDSATESGVQGVDVILYRDTGSTPGVIDATDVVIGTQSTGSDGKYLFSNLTAGNYIAQIPSYEFTSGDTKASLVGFSSSLGAAVAVDPDDDVNNDDNGAPGTATGIGAGIVSLPITLGGTEPVNDGDTDNTSNLTLDFGVVQLLSVGNLVWNDVDNDGTFDAGESGIDGVDVKLFRDNGTTVGSFDSGDTLVATQTTAGGGLYLFTGLIAGEYIIQIPQSEFDTSGTLVGRTSSLGTTAAPDPDDNTNNDDNGTPLAGNGIVTSAFTLTGGQEPTNDGDTDANSNLSIDLGITQLLSLGNLVWQDNNNNGIRDSGEPGLKDVDVKLFRDNGTTAGSFDAGDTLVATDTTDTDGLYQFTDLTPDNYLIQIPQAELSTGGTVAGFASSLGTTAAPDPDNDTDNDDNGTPSAGNGIVTQAITLAVGAEPTADGDGANANQTLDIGLVPANASLAGFVYVDADDDGVFDAGETPIPNVTVTLTGTDLNGAAVTRTGTTKADGSYLFDALLPGTYKVTETQPAGFADGKDTAGSSGGTVTNDMIDVIVLDAGENSVNNNFGELRRFSKRLFLASAIPGDVAQ